VATSAKRLSSAIALSLFFITVAAFLRPPLLPAIGRDLSLSALGLGALGSVFALGRLAADVPAGRLSDRVEPGRMMMIAAAMVAIGSVLLAAAPTSLVAFGAVMVLGAGSTWTLTTAQAFFANAPRARRGAAMSVFAGALLTGQAIGPVVGGGVGSVFDWRIAMASGAVIAIAVVVPFFWIAGERPTGHVTGSPEGATEDHATRLVLAIIYLLPAVQFSIGAAMVQTLVPIVADEEIGLSVAIVGAALGIGGLARLAAALVAGRVMDRSGRRPALIPGLALQLAGVVMFAVWPGLASLWISIALVSFGSISVNVGTAMLADLSEGGRLGPRLGNFRLTGDAAFLVAPALGGWLFDISGRAAATAPLVALTALVLLGSILWLPETHPVS
jgi:MFS family permease